MRGQILKIRHEVGDKALHIHLPQDHLGHAGVKLGEFQHVVDLFRKGQVLNVDLLEGFLQFFRNPSQFAADDIVGPTPDQGQGRSQFMAEVGEKIGLQGIDLLQFLVGLLQLDLLGLQV